LHRWQVPRRRPRKSPKLQRFAPHRENRSTLTCRPIIRSSPVSRPARANFIAAARRAAQAAAASAPERQPRAEIEGLPGETSTPRLRKLLVAGGAILVLFGFVHVALHMFQDTGATVTPPVENSAPPAVLPDSDPAKSPPPSGPLVLPIPGGATDNAPSAAPDRPQSTAPQALPNEQSVVTPPPPAMSPPPVAPAAPARQSSLQNSADVTGSIPRRAPAPPPAIIAPAQAPSDAVAIEKLPVAIGGPSLRAAALAGDAAAEFEVATRFAEGRGLPPSNEEAARWLDRAAKHGLAPAQFRLGGFYEKGIGVKKDLAAARDLYRAAADKGNGKAMHNLAVLYAEGINGPADYRNAAHWFRKAADHGITDSQYNLAILSARGIGVEQNYAESYKWFLIGANAGDGEAAKKRDEVASHLDAQSLAAAQAAAQKWTAEPQPDDAINVKLPPGGWDPQPTAKAKVRVIGAKPAAPEAKLN
jgi:localization factor PodJL